jgi:hypothetical protein
LRVVATGGTGPAQVERQLRLSPGHFVDYPTLGKGTWRFSMTATINGRTHRFSVSRLVK